MFKKAVKHESKLRLAIAGPSGSGKTYTSLAIGTALGKVAVVDTESGSASKYADLFDFDVMEIEAPFHPNKYIEAIKGAAQAGYDVVILDSLSHAWFAEGGVLSIVDAAAARSRSGNSYTAWKEGTPIHNSLITAILTAKIHVIGTMRSKTEYVMTTNDKGKQAPQKMGMAPVQRDGMEYEFDVMIDMDINNRGIVTKTRCSALTGAVIEKPGADVAQVLKDWLSGEPMPEKKPEPPTPAMMKKLHAIGVQKFGSEWDDARHELIGNLTDGRTKSSKELSYDEVVEFAGQLKEFDDYVAPEVEQESLFDGDDSDHTEDAFSIY